MNFFAENLKYLRSIKGLKQYEMADRLGFERTTYNGYEKGKSQPYLDGIIRISIFFGVSETELLHTDLSKSGNLILKKTHSKKHQNSNLISKRKGNLKEKSYPENDLVSLAAEDQKSDILHQRIPHVITLDTQGNENVVLVPVRARAGYLSGYADPQFIETLPAYRLPGLNNGTYRLFEVDGLSMYPTLHSGDLVIGQNVEQLRFLRDDRVYVLVTKNDGVVVKRVLNRIEKDGKLILKSDNYKDREMYPPIVCFPNDAIEVWYVVGYISRQMRPPAEIYNRVIDLEGRLTLLESRLKNKQ